MVESSSLSSFEIYHAIPFWLVKVLLRNQLIILWDFHCMLSFFSLLAFKFLSLFLTFVSLITTCLSVFFLEFILPGTVCLLYLVDYVLSHVRGVFSYYLFKYFLRSFLSSPSGTHIMQISVCLMLSQRCLRLSSFIFILFSIFCFTAVISTVLSSRSLIYSSASVILLLTSSVLFISVCSLVLLGLR